MSSLLYVRFRSNGIAPFLREAGVEDLGPAAFFPTGRTRIQSGWEETEYIIAQRPPLFTEVEVPAKPDTDESETMDDDRGVGSNPSRWQASVTRFMNTCLFLTSSVSHYSLSSLLEPISCHPIDCILPRFPLQFSFGHHSPHLSSRHPAIHPPITSIHAPHCLSLRHLRRPP
jgi:hypothetical protein